ncbi:hypothetical protein O3M35_003640 [Rhynocoris fuscipes]|uniref:Ionotropic glutamate receptor L-glutamate and glycine-binding domain-containing protein n=1 Tax=Rhynocoris fuscipes TaxID=488301 RepID=A0AAW1CRF5_9HEMI
MFNSTYKWILWSDNYDVTKSILITKRVLVDSDVTVLYSQDDDVRLVDLYRMHITLPFRETRIAQSNTSRLISSKIPPPSRENFEGIKISATLMPEVKFNKTNLISPLLDRSHEYGIDGSSRYGLAVFMHLAEMCNFSYSYKLSNDWGTELSESTWSGLIGQLQRRETEMSLAPLKYTAENTKVIDYLTSIDRIRPCFTFLRPKMFSNKKALIRPLDFTVWACLLVITFSAMLMFRIVALYEGDTEHNDSWSGSFLMVVAAISQQGLPDSNEKASTRLIYLSLLIVSFFAFAYYNTAILNGLLLLTPNSLRQIEQLLDSDMQLGLLDKPLLRDEFKNNDSITSEVRRRIWTIDTSNGNLYSLKDGVTKIKEEHFALYTKDEDLYAELLNQLSDAEICSISEIEMVNPHHSSAALADNSPYKEIFNRKFILMKERGILNRQRRYWRERKPECHWRQDPMVLSTGPLALAFLVMFFGFILSILVFILEIIVYNSHRKKLLINIKPFEKTQ